MHKDFIQRCSKDSDKFEEKISRIKIVNFSHDLPKNSKAQDLRVEELKGTRDLMDRLVVLAS